ncbi:hypothetical protein IPJ72_03610 [Candidatus Peregrinibacteria bacterium]|nr:MAG: hypothetical protein IPJ72_03610 [Candidatus Peregrinibacteria bacterium]
MEEEERLPGRIGDGRVLIPERFRVYLERIKDKTPEAIQEAIRLIQVMPALDFIIKHPIDKMDSVMGKDGKGGFERGYDEREEVHNAIAEKWERIKNALEKVK